MIKIISFVSFVLIASSARAQEVITLSAPEIKPSNTAYRVERITQTLDDPTTPTIDEGTLIIQFLGSNKEPLTCVYNSTTTPTATTLITGLNKANLASAYAGNATSGSLKQRIHHRLVIMGESAFVCDKTLTGSLTGIVP